MAEGSTGEKTEQPTPKRIRDAREKGQVAKSQEVVTTISLVSVIAYLWAAGGLIQEEIILMFDEIPRLINGDFRVNSYTGLTLIFQHTLSVLLPVLGVAIGSAILSNYIQIGSIFAFESITPKLEKISPASGFKKIFSMKSIVELIKSILKILFLSFLLTLVIYNSVGPLVHALPCGLPCMILLTQDALGRLFIFSAFAFILVAGADLLYQRHSYTKSLMMTKDEVKREYKESEGDPHIKSKRRQLAQELIMGDGGAGATRKSTALVTNPTHFSVAIAYRPDEFPLPVVVAKGTNRHAYFLRMTAEEAGVPVFRNIRLAQALYAETEVNQFVPEHLFDIIAEILVWVERHKESLYKGPLEHGVIDMDAGGHRSPTGKNSSEESQKPSS